MSIYKPEDFYPWCDCHDEPAPGLKHDADECSTESLADRANALHDERCPDRKEQKTDAASIKNLNRLVQERDAEIERLVAEGKSLADKLAATDLLVSRLRAELEFYKKGVAELRPERDKYFDDNARLREALEPFRHLGCSDINCRFRDNEYGTNGGCRCIRPKTVLERSTWREAVAKAIAALKGEGK